MRKLLYQANVYNLIILTFWFLVLRRAKTADVLRVSSGDSSKQDTRGIKGKRNGVIISWVCCSLYFFKSVSTINLVVTFPLVFSSVNQSVHYKHLLKPVCFIQTAFLNLLYHGMRFIVTENPINKRVPFMLTAIRCRILLNLLQVTPDNNSRPFTTFGSSREGLVNGSPQSDKKSAGKMFFSI